MLSYDLWKLFQLVELTEIVAKRDDMNFIQTLNKIHTENDNKVTENMLKGRFIDKGNESFPQDKFHIISKNKPVYFHRKQFLTNLPGELFVIEATKNDRPVKDMPQESTRKFCNKSDNSTLQQLNVQSLVKHTDDIAKDKRLSNNDVLCFTEAKMFPRFPSHPVEVVSQTQSKYQIFFNNSENHYVSIAYGHQASAV